MSPPPTVMPPITINDRTLVLSQTLILENDEVAHVWLPLDGQAFPVTLRFTTDAGDSRARWAVEDGELRMAFEGWDNPLGSGLKKPRRIGKIGEHVIGFSVAHHMAGDKLHVVVIQFYTGGTYE